MDKTCTETRPVAPAATPAQRATDEAAGRLIYLDHFGLQSAPFQSEPNPHFFYGAGDRGQMLYALLYCLRHDVGITVLTGEEGCGKTMLTRTLRACAPQAMEILWLAPPSLLRDEIVPAVAGQLGIAIGRAAPAEASRLLQRALVQRRAAGRGVVLVIDDAHGLRAEAFDGIARLSQLQEAAQDLVRIVLVGQPSLRATMAAPGLRRLDERTRHRFHLAPLGADKVPGYLAFRMQRAGATSPAFDPAAAAMIARGSMGLLRRVNLLADKCLMAAFADGAPRVIGRHVELALNEAALRAVRAAQEPAPLPANSSALGRLWRRYGLGRVGPR